MTSATRAAWQAGWVISCALLGLSSCLDRREPDDDLQPKAECTTCHGGMLEPPFEAAPPFSLAGESDSSARGVGAHQAHLLGNDWSRTIACSDCHLVPSEVDSPGHFDDDYPAEVRFWGVAFAFEADPRFDAESGTCKGTFCHGGSFVGHRPSGGTDTEPSWTSQDDAVAACTGCHGMPPPDPHPAEDHCSDCHKDIDEDRTFLRPELHVDGTVTFYLPGD
jgi:predicted CxxxxCH...CXXCH cytochrome family protein